MKNKTFTRLMALMMIFSLISVSCSKEGDDDIIDQTEDQLPTNKIDAETKIKGKWVVSASGDVRSIEFVEGNNYILEMNASFVSPEAQFSLRAALGSGGRGITAQTAETRSIQRIAGKFTVSGDGRSIMLDDVAQIAIGGISEESFTFTIKFTEDNREQSVTTTIVAPVDASSKTTLLARNWGFAAWAAFDTENKNMFESHGFKPQDQGIQFTASGTMIMRYISFVETWVEPEPGQQPVSVYTDVKVESEFYSWQWKDGQQTIITATRGDYSFDISIESLTPSGLSALMPFESGGIVWVMVPVER